MLNKKNLTNIFKAGSTTFFNSSLFFPKDVKNDVYTLYGFVRVADDLVDQIPQKIDSFMDFRKKTQRAFEGTPSGDPIIDNFIELSNRRKFDISWVKTFLDSMADDLCKKEYDTVEEVIKYIYGSANVIGFMMAKILGLSEAAIIPAGYLGQAFQYINFLRDIKEDNELGRRYLPKSELIKYGLENLSFENSKINQSKFEMFMRDQLEIYNKWQKEGEKGFKLIPKKYRIPIKTASDMYKWTGEEIFKNPMIVYQKKVKPKPVHIKLQAFWNFVTNC